MSIFLLTVLICIFVQTQSQDVTVINLQDNEVYEWEGMKSNSNKIKVIAQNFTISVKIQICDIGNQEMKPNQDYLILKNGDDNPLSQDNGRVFAYIKKPKMIYFFSSSVILELHTQEELKKKCTVTFGKEDPEDPTLPPVTTTEAVITYGPEILKYSTVLISGYSIEQYNENKKLVETLKRDIVAMANDYTETEGFCLMKTIKPEDVHIYTLEQCPTQWLNFQNCARLVYSLPVEMKQSCPTWSGYQLTKEHLDLMWSRLASKYLEKDFSLYNQPEIESLLTWWMICLILIILLFATALIMIYLIWRRRKNFERAHLHSEINYSSDTRKISETSLTPPYFQQIPPMFGKTERSGEINGMDNKGFLYDALKIEESDTII